MSEDGRRGITIIAFIGSVFSPYYAWSGRDDPANHCALNVVLYGKMTPGWAMTERRRNALRRDEGRIEIGPSAVSWDGQCLTIDIHETTAPVPTPLRGQVRLYPQSITDWVFDLDARGLHRWWPMAPRSRIEVDLERPDLKWSGSGYFDTNAGDEPLEDGFTSWNWSRADTKDGAAVLYDVERRDGSGLNLALKFDAQGGVETFKAPPVTALPPTPIWRIERSTRADGAQGAGVRHTLEDTPFYSRSMIQTRLLGETVTGMHESLSANRLRADWVRMLLPFRMPRTLW